MQVDVVHLFWQVDLKGFVVLLAVIWTEVQAIPLLVKLTFQVTFAWNLAPVNH